MTSNKYIDPLTSSRCLIFVLIMIIKLALMYVHIIDDGRSMMSMVLGISLLGSLMPRTVDSCSASSEEEFMPAVKFLLCSATVLFYAGNFTVLAASLLLLFLLFVSRFQERYSNRHNLTTSTLSVASQPVVTFNRILIVRFVDL